MSIPRGTTPTFTLAFTDIDLTAAYHVYVTFSQDIRTITKTGDALEVRPTEIDVYLNQRDTLAFIPGNVDIQANWTTAGGDRMASDIVTYEFTKQLLPRVVE